MRKMRKARKQKITQKKQRQKRQKFNLVDLVARYAIALALSINSLFIFYYIFRPLTFYPVLFVLKLFYSAALSGLRFLIVNGYEISLVDACVAGSAYYMLTILNLTTRGITFSKRIKIFLFDAASLLALNILRIVILAILFVESSALFDVMHFVFWHVVSISFVIFIWLFTIKIYKIKTIPIWSDIVHLKSFMKKGKR